MAASLASSIRRFPEARSRSQMASWPAALSSGPGCPGRRGAVLFVAGHDAVRQRLGDAPGEAFLQGLLDVQVRGVTALGDGLEGLAEGDLVEAVGRGGLGGELDYLLVAVGVGLAALGVGPLEERSLLAAVTAGAVQGLEESG